MGSRANKLEHAQPLRCFGLVLHRTSHTAHNIATSEISAFHAGYLKRSNKGHFCCLRAFKSNHDNSSPLKKCVVLELALAIHLPSCCEETRMVTLHFLRFCLLVIGTWKTYFKKKKSWILEVVVFTYDINDVKVHLESDTECKVMTVAI